MTIRGILCVALDALLLVIAFGSGSRELMIAALTLLVFWVFSLLSVLLAGLTLRFGGEIDRSELERGESVRYRLCLFGFLLFPITGHLSILPPGVPPRDSTLRRRHAFFLMPPLWRRRIYEFELPCPHQGSWRAEWERIILQDLFGLFGLPLSRRRRAQASCPVTVFPRVYDLGDVREEASVSNGTALTQLQNATSGELLGDTRQYQPGDSSRRIHWKQTARTHEIYVRQFEAQENPRNLLLLDAACLSVDRESAADIAAETVTTLARFELAHGRHVRVLLLRGMNDAAAAMGGTDTWLQNDNDFDRLLRTLPAIEFHSETAPLDSWQLRDMTFTGAGAIRVITDNPSTELFSTLTELQTLGHRVTCYVPAVEETASAVARRAEGGELPVVCITSPEEIVKKVGDGL